MAEFQVSKTKRWRDMSRLVVLLFIVALSCACLPGDRSIQVTFVNEANAPITVFPFGRDYPDWQFTLAPADRVSKNLLAGEARPDTHVARVEGLTADRSMVFCHDYTYG